MSRVTANNDVQEYLTSMIITPSMSPVKLLLKAKPGCVGKTARSTGIDDELRSLGETLA